MPALEDCLHQVVIEEKRDGPILKWKEKARRGETRPGSRQCHE